MPDVLSCPSMMRQGGRHPPGQQDSPLRSISGPGWDRSGLSLRAVTATFDLVLKKSRLVRSGSIAILYHTLKGMGVTFRRVLC